MRTGHLEGQLGMDAALERSGDWGAAARAWIARSYPGERFSADDLRPFIGAPPNPNAFGAVFRSAKRAGLIRYTGEQVLSTRPETHGRYLRVWERCP